MSKANDAKAGEDMGPFVVWIVRVQMKVKLEWSNIIHILLKVLRVNEMILVYELVPQSLKLSESFTHYW